MFIYFFVAFVLIFLHNNSGIPKKAQLVFLFFVAMFLCGGYMCGSDWRGYEEDYTEESITYEPGYYFLAKIARQLGFGFWGFEILLKFVCLVFFYKYINRHCYNNKYLCMLFYFSFYAIYLFIDGPLRNLCAITLFIIALDVYERSKTSAIIISLVGMLFHSSSIISCVYFIARIISEKKNIGTVIYVAVYVLALFVSFQGSMLVELANQTTIGQLLFAEKLDRYVVKGFSAASTVSSPTSLGELLRTFFFFLVLSRRKQIEAIKEGKTLFFGAMIYFIISKLAASMDVLMRFECYFSIFYAIALTVMIDVITPSFKKLYKTSFIVLSLMFTYTTTTTDYRFVPYSNYFVYLIFHQPLPSYNERFNYNFIHSPYK